MTNKAKFTVVLLSWLIILGFLPLIGSQSVQAGEGGKFVLVPVENPEYNRNELFPAYENYYSPRVKKLRERYNLDSVVAGETDEWKRILLLRHWIRWNIEIENVNPTRTRGDTFGILDAALKGGAFHCAHFSIVQQGVYNSFGYVTRRLGAGPGLKTKGGHHGINEVWVNKFSKWVLIDAKYDLHFEKDGVPLSALEIRDEVWKDEGKSVVRSFGLEGTPNTDLYKDESFGPQAETYRWVSWETSTNRFTAFPASGGSSLVMYADDIFRNNIWYRDSKPHWAYNTPFLLATPRREWIYWTPNVITSKVRLGDDSVNVSLTSFTPNFRSYQVKRGTGPWVDCDESVDLPLKKELNHFVFRTMNLFGVTGPEHHVKVGLEK
ncbi:MAG: hypothetical protein ACYS9Y_12395 [Planctomycetota bacterium]|jgi:hypothetical protein